MGKSHEEKNPQNWQDSILFANLSKQALVLLENRDNLHINIELSDIYMYILTSNEETEKNITKMIEEKFFEFFDEEQEKRNKNNAGYF